MSRGNQQDFDELYVVARPPAITRNEIRKAVSEHRGKRFVYDKMEDVREYWIQRYQVKTTYERTTTTKITKPYNSKISKDTNINVIECNRCLGKGVAKCGECMGNGTIPCFACPGFGNKCEDCNEKGIATCGKCDGNKTLRCEECDGKGKMLSYALEKTIRKKEINDAYTKNIENFPDVFLALCTGKQLSERKPTSKYLSPLSYDECQNSKIAAASLDFLNRHQELERPDNRIVKQEDRICAIPFFKVTYIRKKETKYLWIVGTNRKVYDPFRKPSNCCLS